MMLTTSKSKIAVVAGTFGMMMVLQGCGRGDPEPTSETQQDSPGKPGLPAEPKPPPRRKTPSGTGEGSEHVSGGPESSEKGDNHAPNISSGGSAETGNNNKGHHEGSLSPDGNPNNHETAPKEKEGKPTGNQLRSDPPAHGNHGGQREVEQRGSMQEVIEEANATEEHSSSSSNNQQPDSGNPPPSSRFGLKSSGTGGGSGETSGNNDVMMDVPAETREGENDGDHDVEIVDGENGEAGQTHRDGSSHVEPSGPNTVRMEDEPRLHAHIRELHQLMITNPASNDKGRIMSKISNAILNDDLNQKYKGDTALHLAVKYRLTEVLDCFDHHKKMGDVVSAMNDQGLAAIHIAVDLFEQDSFQDSTKEDIKRWAPTETSNSDTDLHSILTPLRNEPSDFHLTDRQGRTPLHHAVLHDDLSRAIKLVEYFRGNQVNPHLTDKNHKTPLQLVEDKLTQEQKTSEEFEELKRELESEEYTIYNDRT